MDQGNPNPGRIYSQSCSKLTMSCPWCWNSLFSNQSMRRGPMVSHIICFFSTKEWTAPLSSKTFQQYSQSMTPHPCHHFPCTVPTMLLCHVNFTFESRESQEIPPFQTAAQHGKTSRLIYYLLIVNWQWWDLNPRLLRDWSLNPAP